MKKAAILILAFYMAFGQLAYASARLECASMMKPARPASSAKMSTDHACCEAVPCQCSIKAPSNDLLAPLHSNIERFESVSLPQISFSNNFNQSAIHSKFFSFESPPGPPQALYSILRI